MEKWSHVRDPDLPARTSVSLLQRLRQPHDKEAWERFVQLYTPLFFYWARRAGLREHDAADLVQDVFTTLEAALNGPASGRPALVNCCGRVTSNKKL
jgi:hypothetical protein